MRIKLLFYFLIGNINQILCFKSNFNPLNLNLNYEFSNSIIDENEKIYNQYKHLGNYKSYFEPNLFSIIHEHNDDPIFKLNLRNEIGKKAVKIISSALPHIDSIGHNILHANNIYINNILNNNFVPHPIQKELILFSIKLAQMGDNYGSDLLQFYYFLVDKSL